MGVTFITGNEKKAEFLAKFLGMEISHQKIDLDELQSLNLREITEHKVKQAYKITGKPVLVEDISFTLDAMGGLPGPFIKWFIQEVGFEGICNLAASFNNGGAVTSVCYAYYDGKQLEFFEGSLAGTVPDKPKGADGFGWNSVFIPKGQTKTNAEMTDEETEKYSLRTTTVYPQLKEFLEGIDKN